MKRFFFLLSLALLFSCQKDSAPVHFPAPTDLELSSPPPATPSSASPLTLDTLLPSTPVKDQGRSPLCWNYAMLATIETNRLAVGDSVNLSPHYLAYCWLREQIRDYYLTEGAATLTLTANGASLLRLMERYGAMPWDSFRPHGEVDYQALMNRLRLMADAAIAHRDGVEFVVGKASQLLAEEIASPPRHVHLLGADYTPQEFARSLFLPGHYEQFTSFAHHPFFESFVLENRDNVFRDSFANLPIDSLVGLVKEKLRRGRAVYWEGDVSNDHFSLSGLAAYHPSAPPTQQQRQRALETFSLTDDHSLALIGLAHDSKGRLYFVAKNSWGEAGDHGLWYLSEDYFRLNTFSVIVPKE